jgi:acetolactate synthase I/III small subunit
MSKLILVSPPIVKRTLAILVDNEAGVLARVIGLFSARAYNIESLTVAEVDNQAHLSRITVITKGTEQVITQIKSHLKRQVCVHGVADLIEDGPVIQRELALLKVRGTGESRIETLRLADAFKARVVDATQTSFVLELTGSAEKLDTFIDLLKPIGLLEVSRTGIVAISRGSNPMTYRDMNEESLTKTME